MPTIVARELVTLSDAGAALLWGVMVVDLVLLGLAVAEDAPAIQTVRPMRMGDSRFFDSKFVITGMLFLTLVIILEIECRKLHSAMLVL